MDFQTKRASFSLFCVLMELGDVNLLKELIGLGVLDLFEEIMYCGNEAVQKTGVKVLRSLVARAELYEDSEFCADLSDRFPRLMESDTLG
jgi:hypothetical protein